MGSVPTEQKNRNREIYERFKNNERPEQIAVDYNITFARVYQIVKAYEKKYVKNEENNG